MMMIIDPLISQPRTVELLVVEHMILRELLLYFVTEYHIVQSVAVVSHCVRGWFIIGVDLYVFLQYNVQSELLTAGTTVVAVASVYI